jgi:hypothetical protein
MAPRRSSSDSGKGGLRRSGDDAFQLTVDYLKQETIEPLKGMWRFLKFGISGSFALAIGILLLLVGVLRLLQEETGTALTGDLSWVPYMAVLVLGAGVIGVAAWRIFAGPAAAKLPKLKARAEAEKATGPGHSGLEPSHVSTREGSS